MCVSSATRERVYSSSRPTNTTRSFFVRTMLISSARESLLLRSFFTPKKVDYLAGHVILSQTDSLFGRSMLINHTPPQSIIGWNKQARSRQSSLVLTTGRPTVGGGARPRDTKIAHHNNKHQINLGGLESAETCPHSESVRVA